MYITQIYLFYWYWIWYTIIMVLHTCSDQSEYTYAWNSSLHRIWRQCNTCLSWKLMILHIEVVFLFVVNLLYPSFTTGSSWHVLQAILTLSGYSSGHDLLKAFVAKFLQVGFLFQCIFRFPGCPFLSLSWGCLCWCCSVCYLQGSWLHATKFQ